MSAIDDAINQIVEPSPAAVPTSTDDVKEKEDGDVMDSEVDGIVTSFEELDIKKHSNDSTKSTKEIGSVKDDNKAEGSSSAQEGSDPTNLRGEITTTTRDAEMKHSDLVVTEKYPQNSSSDHVEKLNDESAEVRESVAPVGNDIIGDAKAETIKESGIEQHGSLKGIELDGQAEVEDAGSDKVSNSEISQLEKTDEKSTSHLEQTVNDAVSSGNNHKTLTTDSTDSTESKQQQQQYEEDGRPLVGEGENQHETNENQQKSTEDEDNEIEDENVEPIHYEFLKENLRPKYKPPLFCRECNQDGHVSKRCPHANLRVDALPPMEEKFADRLSAACESVMQDMALQPVEFDMRIKVLERLEACLKLQYKSKSQLFFNLVFSFLFRILSFRNEDREN